MLGTLSLMACTLLLAAVPSLSSSLQPREEVDLPAIGYVMAGDVRTGIMPLAAGSSEDITSGLSVSIDVSAYFADEQTDVVCPARSLLNFTYTVADGLSAVSSTSYVASTMVYISSGSYTDLDLYLPDLSYWELDSSTYRLDVILSNGTSYYSTYGNYLDDTDLYYTLAELGEDVNPVGAIGDGLGVIGALGGALSSGFDGVFLDNGALTSVGTFSFVLLGLGISVGIVKKCFNWVTGRHGM